MKAGPRGLEAWPSGGQGSHQLRALAAANAPGVPARRRGSGGRRTGRRLGPRPRPAIPLRVPRLGPPLTGPRRRHETGLGPPHRLPAGVPRLEERPDLLAQEQGGRSGFAGQGQVGRCHVSRRHVSRRHVSGARSAGARPAGGCTRTGAICARAALSSALRPARSSARTHCRTIGTMPVKVATSVAAHSSAPPARVLDRVYIEAMGARWDMMAIPRKALERDTRSPGWRAWPHSPSSSALSGPAPPWATSRRCLPAGKPG